MIMQSAWVPAVIISMEGCERRRHESELVRSLARGETEVEAGRGNDLDTVLAEADTLLEEMQR